MLVAAVNRASIVALGRRNPLARQKFGKGVLGLGIAHHLCGVAMLCRPAPVEALRLLLEQQRLTPLTAPRWLLAIIFAISIVLDAKLSLGDQVIKKSNAIGLLGLHDARGEQQLLGLRPADLTAE